MFIFLLGYVPACVLRDKLALTHAQLILGKTTNKISSPVLFIKEHMNKIVSHFEFLHQILNICVLLVAIVYFTGDHSQYLVTDKISKDTQKLVDERW